MKIVYHIGAHSTDDDRLMKTLLANKGVLAKEGIVVPAPSRYRPILRETIKALAGQPASEEVQQVVLDVAMDTDDAARIVFCNENFICVPDVALLDGVLYTKAGDKSRWLRNVFPSNEVEFFMGLRNPATFLPAIAQRQKDRTVQEFLAGFDPMSLLWSDVIRSIREQNPDCAVTVWCNEDTPLLWPELIQVMSGHSPGLKLEGLTNLLDSLMNKEGRTRMKAYLDKHAPANEGQRRRIIAAFLEKFGIEDRLEEEFDMPGWTQDYVDALTAKYEADMAVIEAMPGVTFVTP